MNLSQSFVQMILRLALGLTVVMGTIPARQVPSAFFRIHLWIVMGLCTLTALLIRGAAGDQIQIFWSTVAAAAWAYFVSIIWLYERKGLGKAAIIALSGIILLITAFQAKWTDLLGMAASSLLLGSALAAMLLGHWYLNTPTMRLEPLRQLIFWIWVAILATAIHAMGGMVVRMQNGVPLWSSWWTLRWLAGIVLPAVISWLAWKTLKIPNTQSATGLLYVVVVLVFLGESLAFYLTG